MNILGKGFDAINILNDLESDDSVVQLIQLSKIEVGKYQPRTNEITSESIAELKQSIKMHGVLQPIIVRKKEDVFELIAGERRYLSAIELGHENILSMILSVSETDALSIALIENIQRNTLEIWDQADTLLKLKVHYNLSVDKIALLVSRPRSTVANLIRVAELISAHVKSCWIKRLVNYGHVRAIILLNHEIQNLVIEYIIKHKLSVRMTEKYINEKKYIDHKITNKTATSIYTNEQISNIKNMFVTKSNYKVALNITKAGTLKLSMEFLDMEKVSSYLYDLSREYKD